MAERDKVSGFRLPEETLEQLDELIEWGIIKNRTDGVIRAINSYHNDSQYNRQREAFLYYFNRIVEYSKVVKSLERPDAVFPVRLFHGDGGGETIINRISPTHVIIRSTFGYYANTEIVIDLCQNIRITDDDEEWDNAIKEEIEENK